MEHFFSFILVMLIGAAGILTIYLVIDFFEYLKKYEVYIWEEICFEKPFGIDRDDFFFYPVKPSKFIPFLLDNDQGGSAVGEYKKRIKFACIGLIGLILFNFIARIFI
ncbi:MAG: hypothetical protein QNJ58_03895 [Desulfobacterales bacterium]|nr:hypothetical protein [Desulfobacterales bacterium]